MDLKPVKPLSGFIELLPKEQQIFDEISKKMTNILKTSGFNHIDLPSIERAEVLTDKENFDEIETQMFLFQKADTKMGLRYDGTIGLSRYVSKNISDLVFPARLYQFAKNYRGERPKRGRYREFYQLDMDILGIDTLSLNYDAEIIFILSELCESVKYLIGDVSIKIGDRQFWNAFCDFLQIDIEKRRELFILIDKKDKIVNFEQELVNLLGIEPKNQIIDLFNKGYSFFANKNEKLDKAINDLDNFKNLLSSFSINNYEIDLSIMRGHAYYTGVVFEIFADKYPEFGAICGGGRYENLTQKFSKTKIIGVGAAVGFSRLIMNIIEEKIDFDYKNIDVSLLIMDNNCLTYGLSLLKELHDNKISSVPFLEIDKKFKSKIEFANKINSEFSIIIGEDELNNRTYQLKNMKTGLQEELTKEKLIEKLKQWKKN